MTPSAQAPKADEPTLDDAARTTLVRLLRVTFPHQGMPDGPYERTADTIIEAANESIWFRLSLIQGLATLGTLSGGTFLDSDEAAATTVVKHVEGTDFFGFVRRTAVVSLYDDPEVWTALGYEGSSYDEGGYIDRGFDDLDWLPAPRVEEYVGPESILEVAHGLPGAATVRMAQQQVSTTTTEASHPGVAPQQAQEISTGQAL